jgi:hypothetical protein
MPAFRVVVNSASVHGSIGYTTNLFPAMTLGCGAPGGNITSDNIGPQHLMNVKRIAWESRGVEHRTVPAEQRMAGAAISPAPEAVQEKTVMAAASAPASTPAFAPQSPLAPMPTTSPASATTAAASKVAAKLEEKKTAPPAADPAATTSGVDRTAIARVVENVLAAQGIARGSGLPKSTHSIAELGPTAAKELTTPASIAAEIADRFFSSPVKPDLGTGAAAPQGGISPSGNCPPEGGRYTTSAPVPDAGKKIEPPAKKEIEVQVFVSENDVRRAMTRSEKIFIGRKTILTPSARDLGLEHEVFVETETGSIR